MIVAGQNALAPPVNGPKRCSLSPQLHRRGFPSKVFGHVTPPSQPNTKAQNEYAKVSKLSGSALGSEFARDMVRDHKMTIAGFKKEPKRNGPVKQFAQASLRSWKII